MKAHLSNLLLKVLIVAGIIILMILASANKIHGQTYDTLNKGDKVWIMDGDDSGFGRVAEIAVDWFGKDYFGNNSWVLIKFDNSGSGMRGIELSSLCKIHTNEELRQHKEAEQRYLYSQHLAQGKEYILYDVVYNDYYSDIGWVVSKRKAKIFTLKAAQDFLYDYRVNEKGEYANTGEKNYPIKIVCLENKYGVKHEIR